MYGKYVKRLFARKQSIDIRVLARFIKAQYHGLWPCNPERLCRSGVQLVKRKSDDGRNDSSGSGSVSGSLSQSVFDRISPSIPGWIMISNLDSDCDSDTDPDPDGMAVRPAVRGRPKPRLPAVIDYLPFASHILFQVKGLRSSVPDFAPLPPECA